MSFWDYCKGKAEVLLINAGALLVLCVYLLMLNNSETSVFLITVVWIAVLLIYLLVQYISRRKYFRELMSVLDGLDRKYLIAEVMKPGHGVEDKLYWEVLRRSNKSMIEKTHELEDAQREYKEYIESWIHEVKVPITAAHLICENNRNEYTRRILTELDEIENEVEKVLYFARMEHARM